MEIMAALEIEQKFVFAMKDITKKLTAINATYLGKKTFMDTYYDFHDRKLALKNIWLRQRVSTWELKTGNNPKVDPENLKGLGTTYYVEREGEEAISQELDRYDFFANTPTFSDKLALLKPLAIIETTRTSYRLNNHTKIDLDQARLLPTLDLEGKAPVEYSIGEIEIMVHSQQNINDSHNDFVEEELRQVRDLIGVETSQKLLSKLDKYFMEFLPEFYKSYPYHTFYV